MSNRKKILFLIESLSGGGAEKILSILLRNIDKSRFDVTLCCIVNVGQNIKDIPNDITYKYVLKNPNDCKSRLSKLIYTIKYKLVYSILQLKWVYRFWIPNGNDVEIAFVEGYSTKLLSHSTSKYRKIAWLHTDFGSNHWTNIIYRNDLEEEIAYSKYDDVVCVSKMAKESLLNLYPKLKSVVVKYNPIDDKKILDLSKENIDKNFIPNSAIKLISTGRLVQQKGYDRLLPIIKRLIDEGIDISLTILGEGEDRNILEKYIVQNNLQNIVFLPGFVDNPYAVLAQHDIFVCSSRAEGYSTAVTEALILGLPVITTDCSGMKELLGENNEYGIIVENDDESLYLGLKQLLTQPSLIENYKQKATNRQKDFSLNSLMAEIQNFIS